MIKRYINSSVYYILTDFTYGSKVIMILWGKHFNAHDEQTYTYDVSSNQPATNRGPGVGVRPLAKFEGGLHSLKTKKSNTTG